MTALALSRVEMRHSPLSAFALVALLAVAACGGGASGDGGKTSAAGSAESQLMDRGVNLLYQANDPIAAQGVFREVLKQNPSHYGARYQLAVALDRNGKPADARREWVEVRRSAEASGDSATLATARARLAAPDTVSQSAMMAVGLDLLNKKGDASGAAAQFRRVLERNPTHYGATYQLATALDKMGQRTQARPVWEKVLGMAVSYKDEPIIQAARNRLR